MPAGAGGDVPDHCFSGHDERLRRFGRNTTIQSSVVTNTAVLITPLLVVLSMLVKHHYLLVSGQRRISGRMKGDKKWSICSALSRL